MRHHWRKIVVRDVEYTYLIGVWYLTVKSPDGQVFMEDLRDVTGRDIERGRWKKTSDGMVEPHHVAAFICKTLKANSLADS